MIEVNTDAMEQRFSAIDAKLKELQRALSSIEVGITKKLNPPRQSLYGPNDDESIPGQKEAQVKPATKSTASSKPTKVKDQESAKTAVKIYAPLFLLTGPPHFSDRLRSLSAQSP